MCYDALIEKSLLPAVATDEPFIEIVNVVESP
jgi:hypothetical protein